MTRNEGISGSPLLSPSLDRGTKGAFVPSTMGEKRPSKTETQTTDSFGFGLSEAEQRLVDLLDIQETTQRRAKQGRRVNGYLRIFSAVVDLINGASRTFKRTSQPSLPTPASLADGTEKKPAGLDQKV